MPMKFKDFRQTQLFQQMDICQYYDKNQKLIPDKLIGKKLYNKEVLRWKLLYTPPFNTLGIFIDI